MSDSKDNNKRIAKNTVMLYVRMLLLILVNLYTSRVVLNALGVEDYGLYAVVGAVVVFLGFVNSSMTAASQRFLAFSKGKDDATAQNAMFNSVSVAQIIIAIVILVVAESAGTFYIEHYLNVASHKVGTAHIVFQFSLFSLLVKTITVPYNAAIIANEKMSAFAMISIVEGLLQLGAATSLVFFTSNRLVLYAAMMFLSVFFSQLAYRIYSLRHFPECRLRRTWNKQTVKEIFSYSGWNLLGALSSVAVDQGVNMILNAFFGVIVNAARGIAFQVSSAIASLSGNFQQALNPQIVKSYARNDLLEMHKLVMKGARFSFYLLLLLSVPIFCNIHSVLVVWLKNVPEYTEIFCQLVLINALINASSGTLLMGAMATGNIKKYQIIVAGINLMNFPVSLVALHFMPNPYLTVYIMIGLSFFAFLARLILVSRMIKFSIMSFVHKVVRPIFCVLVATALILGTGYHFIGYEENLLSLVVRLCACFMVTLIAIVLLGVTKGELQMVVHFAKNKLSIKR